MVKIATMAEVRDNQGSRLAFNRLDLTDFRNYPSLRIELAEKGPQMVVLSGENGAGKTNLLEAISYLGPGRGLRGARLGDVTTKDARRGWAVSGRLATADKTCQIGCGIELAEGNEFGPGRARRIVVCDGQKLAGSSALAPVLTIIWLTPKMDRLFQEGASERRRFFDQLVTGLYPGHASQISAFEKAMRERIRLLIGDGRGGDEVWLSALERRMAEHGIALAAARLEVLALVRSHLSFANDAPFPLPDLGLEGEVEEMVSSLSALEAEEAFVALLKGNRRADQRAGRTLRGPHKTDLLALHPDKGLVAGLCSTGEQKAMLIGILLAAVRLQVTVKERPPVLLLDEVIAHLDEDRRRALFKELIALGVQTWMTGTDSKLFQPLKGKAQFFTVKDGNLEKIK
ncbi:MAG: DNA replication/repair protein RecF [Sphingomonadales bacterium]